MGHYKDEYCKKLERDTKLGPVITKLSAKRLQEAEETYDPFIGLLETEAVDDDDLVAIECIRQIEESEFSKFLNGEIALDDVIPNERPIYLEALGFDDGTLEELMYLHKKYPNIILVDQVSVSSTDIDLSEAASEFEDFSALSECSENADYELQRKLERMASELENLF